MYVSPYNDRDVMAGQGTVAVEILEQLQEAAAHSAVAGGGAAAAAAEGAAGGGGLEGADLVVYIPVGGGGLIGGMAAVSFRLCRFQKPPLASSNYQPPTSNYHQHQNNAKVLKAALGPRVHVVGCQPAASDVMRLSVAAGRIVEAPCGETLSDATAGGIEEGAITLAPCIAAVDEW